MKKNNDFTLIEILVVVGLIVIVLGVSIAFMNRTPARLVVVNTAAAIEQKMTLAQTQASLQGIQKTLIYNSEKKMLFFSTSKPEDDNEFNPADQPPPQGPEPSENGVIVSKNYIVIPKSIEVSFPDFDENLVVYNFYPDSAASGPDMLLTLKGHELLIAVSPLTGIATTREIDNEKYY